MELLGIWGMAIWGAGFAVLIVIYGLIFINPVGAIFLSSLPMLLVGASGIGWEDAHPIDPPEQVEPNDTQPKGCPAPDEASPHGAVPATQRGDDKP